MSRKSFKYQEEAIEKVKDLPYAMLNMACGTGKTSTAIHIAQYKEMPTIIIAPKNVLSSWHDELLAEGIAEEDIWIYSAEDKRKGGEKYMEELKEWCKND